MLVLTLSIEDSVVIGDNITVKLVGLKYGRAMLGFEAPREIPIQLRKKYREKKILGNDNRGKEGDRKEDERRDKKIRS